MLLVVLDEIYVNESSLFLESKRMKAYDFKVKTWVVFHPYIHGRYAEGDRMA